MSQGNAPFWDALRAYQRRGVIPFHTPGHKLKTGPFANIEAVLGSGVLALDPSDQIENLDLNHDFELALDMAEQLAAELFGAAHSLFLVNGTTGGLHYLLMPTSGAVLIPRFSHQGVYSAMILSQAHAVYLPVSYDNDWLVPLPPQPSQVDQAFSETQVEALVLTHPTYYGTVTEMSSIIRLAKDHGALVLVDEAHGGHFLFSSDLPATGIECGADAVVQSTHKTLGSLTQTSMLHANNSVWFSKVRQAQRTLQTTSPSFIFFAVLDEVRRVLAEQGRNLVGQALELAHECSQELNKIPRLELLPKRLQADPTKIVFSLRKLGLTGIEVERILRMDYNIQVELSDYYSVLALVALGDTRHNVTQLVAAVRDLVKRRSHLGCRPLQRHRLNVPELPPIPLSLREAFFSDKEVVALEEAAGRISGGFLTPYPPGVPVIAPGEQFTPEVIEHLLWCCSINWPVRGLMPEHRVVILEDNYRFCRKTR